jgi:mRNA interferase MazF
VDWEAEAEWQQNRSRDVRLYSFAPPDKKRTGVVLTRESAIGYLSTVTVVPVTTTIRGVPSEVVLNEDEG